MWIESYFVEEETNTLGIHLSAQIFSSLRQSICMSPSMDPHLYGHGCAQICVHLT